MVFKVPDWDECNPKKNTDSKNKSSKKHSSSKACPKKTSPKKPGKLNGVADRSKLIKKENKLQTRKIKQAVKQKNKNVSSLNVENIDTDKLDEVILNAKKKKFNEALERDDVEDLLFKEDKSPEIVRKEEKKKPYTEKKTKNNNNIVKAKNNKTHLETKPVIDKEVFKVKNNVNNNIESKKPTKLSLQERKKEQLKVMLQTASNRNTINFPRNKLRERMLDRLKSAQFRFLNEKLYTSSGSEAQQLFQNDPTAFQIYHQGYQQQVKKWPVNPLDVIVKRIQKMPKSHLIADMGCGEAALSKRVSHAVRSFDLVATVAGVEACDMARTPLLTASVDVVVYCLALMGTDLTKYLVEANRVLKLGGHLLIAEVESRFTDVNAFTKDVQRLGFKLKNLDNSNQVFFFMEFLKNTDPPVKKAKLPVLTLKPCIYKRR